ncbi:2Fe-2S iron-sulfur cluster-binding protein [Desulforhopalus singaporensis]|uniref:2Fe-2S iron-sulfur cluster-binding protein n=1 Tax=Desulforhopalus singaporensis TaxID=91360 RepID=UPI000B86CBD6|nr:2Fe-2S iron-sulfur cluster-binding protein [Desulforhopalus singaporensis]
MFKQQEDLTKEKLITVVLDGKEKALPSGGSVASGLLAIGEIISRISPSSHKPCSPHCLMGVCCECLMEINGVQRQACLVEVQEGLIINRRLKEQEGEGNGPLL